MLQPYQEARVELHLMIQYPSLMSQKVKEPVFAVSRFGDPVWGVSNV